jgi:hypothetical protein
MPNWCNNTLIVLKNSSEQDFVGFMRKSLKDGVFKLNGAFPTPPELLEQVTSDMKDRLKREYGHDNWYDWRIDNWGTKWDTDESSQNIIEHTDENFWIDFDSAWSPPIEWVKRVSNMYPTLTFEITYMEEGMGFCGKFLCIGGEGTFEEGEIRYVDEDGEEIIWDSNKSCYVYAKNGEDVGEDVNTYPENPFED